MIRLVVGLGNPGKSYENTRHNAGAWFVEQLCKAYGISLNLKTSLCGRCASFRLEGANIHVAIPTTFMNQSGHAVQAILGYYQINPKEMLIVHDELDFKAGVLRLKLGGGAGGHNGLSNIIQTIKNSYFWRFRIGIGHPGFKNQVPQYVLNTPKSLELKKINNAIQNAVEVFPKLCRGEAENVMQTLHSEA